MTAVLFVLILISIWMGFYALAKQQGRILLRLDKIDESRKIAGTGPENPSDRTEPDGLPLKTYFPAFKFPDLRGTRVALEDFRGKRVLLVHWNFECGFCESIARELGQLDTSFQERNVQLGLLTYGKSGSKQERVAAHGLKCTVLLITDEDRPAPSGNDGTQGADLLREQGLVAGPWA